MSTRAERQQELRDLLKRDSIPVHFTVNCESFTVPEMPELVLSAEYLAAGEVTPDTSGDHVTPNGAPEVAVSLLHLRSYTIELGDRELPDWLQAELATKYESEMDAAFLESIGGQDKLDTLAIEKAT
jgi:hypothetical protein